MAKSFQVLDKQFHNIMDFPKVGEYLDQKEEESKLNMSLRASSNAPSKVV